MHRFFAVKTLRRYENFSMTANFVLRMTTTGDKSESESGITWKRFESGNVLTASFGDLEMTKNNKGSIVS